MYNEDTDVLFPPRVIPQLLELRGAEWRSLVSRMAVLSASHPERLAFVLLMIRLGGCTTCHADSFRAMRGCSQCAAQTVKRYRGSEADLFKQFDEAKLDIDQYLIENQLTNA